VPVTENGSSIFTTLPVDADSFSFRGSYPKYDAQGLPYYYVVRETAPLHMSVTYTVTNDPSAGLEVNNSFNSDQGFSVTFRKEWNAENIAAYTPSPVFRLTLVRYLTDGTGSVIAGTRDSDFASAASNGLGNTAELSYSSSQSASSLTWSRLAYYGPNGNPYRYRAEETAINGWTAYSGQTLLSETTLESGAKGYSADISGTYNDIAKSGSGEAGLTNKYGDVLGSVSVKKVWGDSFDLSSRPGSITAALIRKTEGGTPETVKSGILLNSANSWTETDGSLEKYAPDGSLYHYYYVETAVPNYVTTYSSANGANRADPAGAWAAASSASPQQVTVTNKPNTTSLMVSKVWKDTDGNFIGSADLLFLKNLCAVPSSIVFSVQYAASADDGATWSNWAALTKGGKPVTVTINQKADGSFSSAVLGSLPAYGPEGEKIRYRAWESKFTFADGTVKTSADDRLSKSIGNISAKETDGAKLENGVYVSTTTVANELAVRKITINKIWDDEYNRDGKRLSSLAFSITRTGVWNAADTKSANVTLTAAADKTADNEWSRSFLVPSANESGDADSSYSAVEPSVPAEYTASSSVDGKNYASGPAELGKLGTSAFFTNKKSHETFSITSKKLWKFNGVSFDGTGALPALLQSYLPASLTFTLQYTETPNNPASWVNVPGSGEFAGVTAVQTPAVSAASAFPQAGWKDLPCRKTTNNVNLQTPYYYRVAETPLNSAVFEAPVYSSPVVNGAEHSGAAVSDNVTNTVRNVTLSITKKWDDGGNKYGTRPGAVEYTIQYLNGTDWADVPESAAAAGAVPSTAKNPVTASAAQNYGAEISDLPAALPDGTACRYRAVETALVYSVGGVTKKTVPSANAVYTASTADDGCTVTNTLNRTGFAVTKNWGSDPAQIAGAVTGIFVQLKRNDGSIVPSGDSSSEWLIGKDENGLFTMEWDDLPARDPDGNLCGYSAQETALQIGGTRAEAGSGSTIGGFIASAATDRTKTVLTNTPADGCSLSVSKIWNDGGDCDGKRPASVTVSLSAAAEGSPAVLSIPSGVTLSAANGWKDDSTWANLPAEDAAGRPITYTLTEETALNGYTTSCVVSGDISASGGSTVSVSPESRQHADVTFTNTHTPAAVNVTASKIWEDGGNAEGARPSKVIFTLYAKEKGSSADPVKVTADSLGRAIRNPVELTAADAESGNPDKWSVTWEGLPQYAEGRELLYSAAETPMPGYEVSAEGTVVTNTIQTTSLQVKKVWSGGAEALAEDVTAIAYELQRQVENGSWTAADTAVVQRGADDSFSRTWSGLPQYDSSGRAVSYRAVERSVTKGGTVIPLTAYDAGGEKGRLGTFFQSSAVTSGSAASGYVTTVTNTPTQADFSFRKTGTCDELDLKKNAPPRRRGIRSLFGCSLQRQPGPESRKCRRRHRAFRKDPLRHILPPRNFRAFRLSGG
jgi:hypothetical protein